MEEKAAKDFLISLCGLFATGEIEILALEETLKDGQNKMYLNFAVVPTQKKTDFSLLIGEKGQNIIAIRTIMRAWVKKKYFTQCRNRNYST